MFSKYFGSSHFGYFAGNFAAAAKKNPQRLIGFGGILGGGVLLSSLLWKQNASADTEQKSFLDPKQFRPFRLAEIEEINHNTKKFTFQLPDKNGSLQLPVASCIVVKAPGFEEDGKPVIRPYTPITGMLENEIGSFSLAIKYYPEGKMSKYIHNMKLGDFLEVKGPIPKIPYAPNMKKKIGMIAGGSGITPMMQILSKILSNKEDKTEVSLIFANIAERDILFKEYFDNIAKEYPQVKVYYVLEKPPKNWKGGVGYVNAEHIKRLIPPPSDDVLVMVCGPPPMVNAISGPKAPDYSQGNLSGILKDLGYKESQVFKF